MQYMPRKDQERAETEGLWERMRGGKDGRKPTRELEREMLFSFRFHLLFPYLGKTSCNKKPITVSFPCNGEIQKPRVQSGGAGREGRGGKRGREINYLVEASWFIWPRKECTRSQRCTGVHHKAAVGLTDGGRLRQITVITSCAAVLN